MWAGKFRPRRKRGAKLLPPHTGGLARTNCRLSRQLISGLLEIPGLTLYGIADESRFEQRTPTVGIRLKGRSPAELASALGDEGIFTWAGNFYALTLTEALNLEDTGGVLRIGLVHYNTAEEVERVLSGAAVAWRSKAPTAA